MTEAEVFRTMVWHFPVRPNRLSPYGQTKTVNTAIGIEAPQSIEAKRHNGRVNGSLAARARSHES